MPCPLNCTESCQRCYEKVIAGVKEYHCYGRCVVVDQMGISHNGPGEAAPADWTLSPEVAEVSEEMVAYMASLYNNQQTPTTTAYSKCCKTRKKCPKDASGRSGECWGNTQSGDCECLYVSGNPPPGPWVKFPPLEDSLTQIAIEEQKLAVATALATTAVTMSGGCEACGVSRKCPGVMKCYIRPKGGSLGRGECKCFNSTLQAGQIAEGGWKLKKPVWWPFGKDKTPIIQIPDSATDAEYAALIQAQDIASWKLWQDAGAPPISPNLVDRPTQTTEEEQKAALATARAVTKFEPIKLDQVFVRQCKELCNDAFSNVKVWLSNWLASCNSGPDKDRTVTDSSGVVHPYCYYQYNKALNQAKNTNYNCKSRCATPFPHGGFAKPYPDSTQSNLTQARKTANFEVNFKDDPTIKLDEEIQRALVVFQTPPMY